MNTLKNNGASTDEGWEAFAAKVAEVADVRPDEVGRETRLVDDLGVDSLALAELVVLLLVDYGLEDLSESLQDSDWGELKVGALYDECRAHTPSPPEFRWT
jgi:acyl carrier protein